MKLKTIHNNLNSHVYAKRYGGLTGQYNSHIRKCINGLL